MRTHQICSAGAVLAAPGLDFDQQHDKHTEQAALWRAASLRVCQICRVTELSMMAHGTILQQRHCIDCYLTQLQIQRQTVPSEGLQLVVERRLQGLQYHQAADHVIWALHELPKERHLHIRCCYP